MPVVTGVAFSPDGTRLLSGGLEADIRLWDRTTGHEVRSLKGHGGGTANVEFSPDGRRVLSTRGAPRPAAQLWDAQSGRLEREFAWDSGWPTWATFSPDGTRIATAAQNPRILVWDVASGTRLRTLTGQQGFVTTVAFSPDGTRLASGGGSFTPVVHLWDLPSGRILHTFELEAGSVASLDFSSGGHDLLAGWQEIPKDYYDAAEIDGASGWKKLLHITIPLLMPAITVTTVLNLLHGLKVFDIVYVLTNGGPGYATEVVFTSVFKEFSKGRYGISTALSTLLFVIMSFVGFFTIRTMTREERSI